ncbi:hypothetical protein T4D_12523 [Trichinella pseudospiralis]|uniref:Uncharacterized protein n=1 Tax=Trichinella pseudospiralis TaxID=6337 RepID=A0A0V1FZM6_TRIPS|nr:hypothetical protein T4D_12523 [Trichinella pseudospiralis]
MNSTIDDIVPFDVPEESMSFGAYAILLPVVHVCDECKMRFFLHKLSINQNGNNGILLPSWKIHE